MQAYLLQNIGLKCHEEILYEPFPETSTVTPVPHGGSCLSSPSKLSGHEGDQYRGVNTNGPDMHVSYIPGRTDESMHFDWRFPFGSASGLLQHSKDYVVNEFSKGSDLSYDKVGP